MSEDGTSPATDPDFCWHTGFGTEALSDILGRSSTPSTITLSLKKGDVAITVHSVGTQAWSSQLHLFGQSNFRGPPRNDISITADTSVWGKILTDDEGNFDCVNIKVTQAAAQFDFSGEGISGSVVIPAGLSVQIVTTTAHEFSFLMADLRGIGEFIGRMNTQATMGISLIPDAKGWGTLSLTADSAVTYNLSFGRPAN